MVPSMLEHPVSGWFVCLKSDGTEGKSRHVLPAGSIRAMCGTKLDHFRTAYDGDWKCWTCFRALQDRPDTPLRAINDVIDADASHVYAKKQRQSGSRDDDQKKYGIRIVVENMDVFVVGPQGKVPLSKCVICGSRFIPASDTSQYKTCTGLCRRKWCRVAAYAYHRGKTFDQILAQPTLWDF